jgi:hypothetical protein
VHRVTSNGEWREGIENHLGLNPDPLLPNLIFNVVSTAQLGAVGGVRPARKAGGNLTVGLKSGCMGLKLVAVLGDE